MGKNSNEKKMIYEWAVANRDRYHFTEAFENADSYFLERRNSNYMWEYYFDTLPELKEELSKLWKDEDYMNGILQTILVAAMKNRPATFKSYEQNREKNVNDAEKMPAYIYNF